MRTHYQRFTDRPASQPKFVFPALPEWALPTTHPYAGRARQIIHLNIHAPVIEPEDKILTFGRTSCLPS